MKKLYFAGIGEINLRMKRSSAVKIKGKIKSALDCGLNDWAAGNWLTAGVAEPIPQLRVVFPSLSAFSTLAR